MIRFPWPKRDTRFPAVYCHYAHDWIPMGRARTRCPDCGAEVQRTNPGTTHYVVDSAEEARSAS